MKLKYWLLACFSSFSLTDYCVQYAFIFWSITYFTYCTILVFLNIVVTLFVSSFYRILMAVCPLSDPWVRLFRDVELSLRHNALLYDSYGFSYRLPDCGALTDGKSFESFCLKRLREFLEFGVLFCWSLWKCLRFNAKLGLILPGQSFLRFGTDLALYLLVRRVSNWAFWEGFWIIKL